MAFLVCHCNVHNINIGLLSIYIVHIAKCTELIIHQFCYVLCFCFFFVSHLNEHYRPVMELCHPCAVQYDMYTNFKYLPEDAFRVMDLLHIPHHYYLNAESHPRRPTSTLLDDFFNTNITSRLVALLSSLDRAWKERHPGL